MPGDTMPYPLATLQIGAWPDPEVEARGYGPASTYVELCWLPLLGPTATWMYRHLATRLLLEYEYSIEAQDLARALGLGRATGRHGPLWRAVQRLIRYDAARWVEPQLLVRRALPLLADSQLRRLGPAARSYHVGAVRGEGGVRRAT